MSHEYCYIPDSTFLYGKDRVPSKIPALFYMVNDPITVKQFKQFAADSSYDYDLFDIMEQLPPKPDCPATPISWQNAKAYARWSRSVTGEYYSFPSEKEWEIAARGPAGRIYPRGNNLPKADGDKRSFTARRS